MPASSAGRWGRLHNFRSELGHILIIRQKDPNNLEMPFDQLGDFITPVELFYIRSHFPTPELDPVSYRLSIGGAVQRELRLSYDSFGRR